MAMSDIGLTRVRETILASKVAIENALVSLAISPGRRSFFTFVAPYRHATSIILSFYISYIYITDTNLIKIL